jgi:hypothetical protein
LKIWLKGATFHSSPPVPEPTSFHDHATVDRVGK